MHMDVICQLTSRFYDFITGSYTGQYHGSVNCQQTLYITEPQSLLTSLPLDE